MTPRIRRAAVLSAIIGAVFVSGCGGQESATSKGGQTPTKNDSKPTVTRPPEIRQYEGTPYWLTRSTTWPDVLRWTVDSTGEHEFDSLFMRIRVEARQSFLAGPKSKEHPLLCWIDLTVRPVPLKLTGYSFIVDSVVCYDPVRRVKIGGLPMLSMERYTEAGTVRTRFSNNMRVVKSPKLTEDQLLELTLHITSVNKKRIEMTMPPVTVKFLRETRPEEFTPDSVLQWGPS